ncbi:MAG: DNA gyrase subunit A [Myxococcota bacterium]
MSDVPSAITPIQIEVEMKTSYLNYSMSVIRGRALPDVRDGLKPVHRRILYAMHREGLSSSKKYSKCAGVVGEVLKRYHPHGDSAVYDALVRMAQPWNLRYPLVDGQGNFGSVDGDPAAAYRYTECRMTKLAEHLLTDIDEETVGFEPNFDGTTLEPEVLPSAFPNLLVNGSEGIAVGMATKIPPHNLGEIINACVALIEEPELSDDALLEIVPGPDFPTGGTICGRSGIRDAYRTGRGRIRIQGTAHFEDIGSRRAIVITEIPYQVNKSRLITQIAELVRDKKLTGISNLRDESARQGMRVVVELKMDAVEDIVLNHLYKHTQLEVTFGAILLAIVNKQPQVLKLRDMLHHYISHRREVVLRRTRYRLRKAKERAHILEGYRIALRDEGTTSEVIELIRASRDGATARAALVARFELSEIQAQAILDLRLQRLTGIEQEKIEVEYQELMVKIGELQAILGSEDRLMEVVREELQKIGNDFGDERLTRIIEATGERNELDYVAEEDQVVTLSHLGYIKRVPPDEWRMQRRGGMGKKGMDTRDEDFVTSIFVANTHAVLFVFTTQGRVYPLQVYRVPQASRTSRGKPIVNLVPIEQNEAIAAVISVRDVADDDTRDLLFCSKFGLVKRTPLTAFKNLRQGGLIACGVADDDELCVVKLLEPDHLEDIIVLTQHGQCIRFPKEGPKGAPVYGRTARGNKGISLQEGDFVVDMLLVPTDAAPGEEPPSDEGLPPEVEEPMEDDDLPIDAEADDAGPEPDSTLLTVTELGYGKRTPLGAYPRQGRNGKGVISHKTGPGIGGVVGAREVGRDDQLMLVTDTGRVIRIAAEGVRLVKSRSSKGVRLMRLDKEERIVDMELLPAEEAEE